MHRPHGEERRAATRLEPWSRARFRRHPSRRRLRRLLRMRSVCFATSKPELIAALAALEDRREQVVERKLLLAQSIGLAVAREHVDVVQVAIRRAVFPRVVADDLFLLLPRFTIPDERHDAREEQEEIVGD